MHLITVKAPEGKGKNVAEVAFTSGATQVSVWQEKQYTPDHRELVLDVVEVESPVPQADQFICNLMEAPFYHHQLFAFSIRKLEASSAADPAKVETHPVKLADDVYEEMRQFSRFTPLLVGRFFLSAAVLAYGMVENFLALIVAGLLFLPYHHHMLAVGLGAAMKEWHLLAQGLVSLLISTALIVLAAVCVALFTEPPIGWQELSASLMGFVFAFILGVAAGLSAVDDAGRRRLVSLPGRRKLIGLAATAHVAVYPAWFGLKFIFGFEEGEKWVEHLFSFGVSVSSFVVATGVTFAVLSVKGKGTRRS